MTLIESGFDPFDDRSFSLDDLRKQLVQLASPGILHYLLQYLPGGERIKQMMGAFDEKQVRPWLGIIDSMTPSERRDPKSIDGGRSMRIAKGAGVTSSQVREVLKDFAGMATLFTHHAGKGMEDRLEAVQKMQRDMMRDPSHSGFVRRRKKDEGSRLSSPRKKRRREKSESPRHMTAKELSGPNGERIVFQWSAVSHRIEPGDRLILKGRLINDSAHDVLFYDTARPRPIVRNIDTSELWELADPISEATPQQASQLRRWKPFCDRSFSLDLSPRTRWMHRGKGAAKASAGLPSGRYRIGCEMKFTDYQRDFTSTWVVHGSARPKPLDIEIVK